MNCSRTFNKCFVYLLSFCAVGHHKDTFNIMFPDHTPGVRKCYIRTTYNRVKWLVHYLEHANIIKVSIKYRLTVTTYS